MSDTTYDFSQDSESAISRKMTEMGYPIAGVVAEIYEDCVIAIPPLMGYQLNDKEIPEGRVLSVIKNNGNVTTFVLLDKTGAQSTRSYGLGKPIYFALPENTEDKFRN